MVTEQENNLNLDETKEKLYNFIKEKGVVTRKEINNYISPMIKVKNTKDLNNKIRYMLTYLKNHNYIRNIGNTQNSKWMINNK